MYSLHHDMQCSLSTRANYQPDSSGWYPHAYSYGNPSYHPPGLPVLPPPLLVPPPPAPSVPQSPAASSFADILQLDEFWRGRLAPLPGYQSRPGLVPVKETKRIQIGVPTEIKEERLLSPHSFYAKEYHRNALVTPTNDNNTNTEVSPMAPSFFPECITQIYHSPQKVKSFQFDKYVSPHT